jgi:hypothetical protein
LIVSLFSEITGFACSKDHGMTVGGLDILPEDFVGGGVCIAGHAICESCLSFANKWCDVTQLSYHVSVI